MKLREVRTRAIPVAEEALAARGYVSPVDILTGIRMVYSGHVEPWRRGHIDFLLRDLQGTPEKVREAMRVLREWALAKGLQPSETGYVRTTREGTPTRTCTTSSLTWRP